MEATKEFIRQYSDDPTFMTRDALRLERPDPARAVLPGPGFVTRAVSGGPDRPPGGLLPRRPRPAGERLSVTLDRASFDGSPDETVSVWVNGRTAYEGRPGARDPVPVVDLSHDLVPGENLVILRKKRGQPGLVEGQQLALDRAFLGFTSSSRLVATLTDPGATGSYRIERSLPGLVDRYAVYVTVLRPTRPEPVDVRLETELGWLATLLSSRPITWALTLPELRTGSLLRGFIYILGGPDRPPGTVRLCARTPDPSQSLDVEFPADIKVDELFLNFFGVQVREHGLDAVRLDLKGRLQWVQTSPLLRGADLTSPAFALCGRVLSGRSTTRTPVQIRLGDLKLGLDVAPVLQELAVNHVNNWYLQPDQPRELVQKQLQEFFRDADVIRGPRARHRRHPPRLEGGWLRFGFVTGGRGLVPEVVPRSPGDAVRLDARGVALGGSRLQPVLGDRFSGAVSHVVGKGLDHVSGIAVISRGDPPARQPIRVEGSDFAPVVAAYRNLWEGEVRRGRLRLALRVSAGDLRRILPDLFAGLAEVKDLTADEDAFLGDGSLLRQLDARPFDIQAGELSVFLGPDRIALPRLTAQAPRFHLEPLELGVTNDGGSRFVVKGMLSAGHLTAFVNPQRQWEYQDVRVGFRSELPGDPGEKWAVTIPEIEGTAAKEGSLPLSRFWGKTFAQTEGGLQRRSK